MANYLDLENLRADGDLGQKISMAVLVKAQTIYDLASPTTAQITWANEAIANSRSKAKDLIGYVLAANKASDVAAIQAATDAAIQTNVDAAVDKIITGGV